MRFPGPSTARRQCVCARSELWPCADARKCATMSVETRVSRDCGMLHPLYKRAKLLAPNAR